MQMGRDPVISPWGHRYALLSAYSVYYESFSRLDLETPRDVKTSIVADLQPGDVVIVRRFPLFDAASRVWVYLEGLVLSNSESSGLTNLYILADDQVILKSVSVIEPVLMRKTSDGPLISTAMSWKRAWTGTE